MLTITRSRTLLPLAALLPLAGACLAADPGRDPAVVAAPAVAAALSDGGDGGDGDGGGSPAYDPANLPYKYYGLDGCLGDHAVGPVDFWPGPGSSYTGYVGDTGSFGVHAIGRLGVVEYGATQARVSRSVWAFSTFHGALGNGQPHSGPVSHVPRVPFRGDPWTVRPDIECTYVQGANGAYRAATIHLDHCPTLGSPMREACLAGPDRVLCWNYRDQDLDWLGYEVPAAWPMLSAADQDYYYGQGSPGSPHDRASAVLDQLHAQAGGSLARCAESASESEATSLVAEAESPGVTEAIEDLREEIEAGEGGGGEGGGGEGGGGEGGGGEGGGGGGSGDGGESGALAAGAAALGPEAASSFMPQCTIGVVASAAACAASTVAAGAVLTSWLTANRKAVREGVELSYLSSRNIALTSAVAVQWTACGTAIFAASACTAAGAVALRPFLIKAFAWSNAIFLGVFGVSNVEQTVTNILNR
jgi:uncharacterized membrane protein YgcG